MYIPNNQLYRKKEQEKSHIYTEQKLLLVVLNRALTLGWLGERLLPHLTRRLFVQPREENVEDIRVPTDGVAFDALLDVL